MIWVGGWRQRSRRREVTAQTPPREAQRLVLAVVLREHPEQLSLPELVGELLCDGSDFSAALILASAVCDLVAAGLLLSNGVLVAPTRAALHFERLVMGQ